MPLTVFFNKEFRDARRCTVDYIRPDRVYPRGEVPNNSSKRKAHSVFRLEVYQFFCVSVKQRNIHIRVNTYKNWRIGGDYVRKVILKPLHLFFRMLAFAYVLNNAEHYALIRIKFGYWVYINYSAVSLALDLELNIIGPPLLQQRPQCLFKCLPVFGKRQLFDKMNIPDFIIKAIEFPCSRWSVNHTCFKVKFPVAHLGNPFSFKQFLPALP